MTDNKIIGAFKRLLTMTLALVMVLGSAMPLFTQEASAFNGKVGSKYTVHWYRNCTTDPAKEATVTQLSATSEMISEAVFLSAYSRIKTLLCGQEIKRGPCR